MQFYPILGGCFASLISVASYRLKFLSLSGTIATFLLAWCIFSFGGVQWTVPMLMFFISSSILSKMQSSEKKSADYFFEKSNSRDYLQVLANGGIGGLLVVLNFIFTDALFFLVYCGTLASVCGDTWATEIGTFRKSNTYNILTFKSVEQGESGGISLPGTLGSVLGSLVIAFSGIYWYGGNILFAVFLITLAGVAGSFADSILGAAVQNQNRCAVCMKITERQIHCGQNTAYAKGWKWMNNDAVNLSAGLTGGVSVFLLAHFNF